jgi:2'-hydroxyisoflavone reductase
MRLLVLGGTGFVGRAVVEAGRARGAEITVFNRGRQAPPAGVTALVGDRLVDGGLAVLTGRQEWDVVVDTWSTAPFAVQDAARLLSGRVGRYVYVSSRSVYVYPQPLGLDESGPLVEGDPGAGRDGTEIVYPVAKRGGELAAEAAFGDRVLLARAGIILGPYEDVGRLPWWLERIARGGPVVAPGPPDLGLQYIDARDLAEWLLVAAERGLGGPYNLVSRPGATTMRELLEICVRVTGAEADLRWVDPQVLLDAGVRPGADLPMWLPPGTAHDSTHGSDVSKAFAAGLRCRPIGDTVADTWAWLQARGAVPSPLAGRSVGLDPAVEARLLGAVDPGRT